MSDLGLNPTGQTNATGLYGITSGIGTAPLPQTLLPQPDVATGGTVAPALPPLGSTFAAQLTANLQGQQQNTAALTPTAFLSPSQTAATQAFAGQPTDANALITNLPNARAALAAKYARLGQQLQTVPTPIRSSLFNMDLQRVNAGQMPLSDAETGDAIAAAETHQQITPAHHDTSIWGDIKNLPGNVVSDLGAVTVGAAHLLEPNRGNPIYQELFNNLPKWLDVYHANLKAGMNPAAAFLRSPGIRFIPGSFIAANLLSGAHGLGNLLQHPLFTALDALPYASEAAGATELGQVAEGEGVRPIRAALTRTLLPEGSEIPSSRSVLAPDEDGNLVDQTPMTRLAPNKLGQTMQSLANTKVGSYLSQAFGQDARHLSQITGNYDATIADAMNPNGSKLDVSTPFGRIADLTRQGVTLATKTAQDLGVTDAERGGIAQMLEDSRDGLDWVHDQRPEVAQYARSLIELNQNMQAAYQDAGELPVRNGEVYTAKQATAMDTAQSNLDAVRARAAVRVLPRLDSAVSSAFDDAQAATEAHANNVDPSVNTQGPAQAAQDYHDKLAAIHQATLDAINPDHPGTFKDVKDQLTALKRSSVAVGSSVTGEGAGPSANMRLDSLANISDEIRKGVKAEGKVASTSATLPGRFVPLVQKLAGEKIVGGLVESGVDPEDATRTVAMRDFAAYPEQFTPKVLNDTVDEIAKTWQDLRDAGADPQYVHHITRQQANLLAFPRVADYATDLSSTGDRSLYAPKPYIRDVALALSHQGAEFLAKDLNQSYIDTITSTWGRTGAQMGQMFGDEAWQNAADDPRIDPLGEQQRLARESGYRPYDPSAFNKFPPPSNYDPASQIWMPKAILDNLERIHDPRPGALAGLLAAPTQVFKTSVLGLSPRFLINHTIGHMVMQLAENGPMVYRDYADAIALNKAMAAGEDVSDRVPIEIRGSMNYARRDLADTPLASDPLFQRGGKLAEAWAKIQELKPVQAVSWLANKNYDLNAWLDDNNRLMSYLHGERKAFGDGLSGPAAQAAALETAYRTSMFWSDLTPIERTVIRPVVPFYGFTAKLMRFVLNYPFDHPARTAIMSNIAQAELHDQGSGLGLSWLNSLGLGPVNSKGKQLRLQLKGLNPFADVADKFTFAGFLAGLNPVLSSVAEAAGMKQPGSTYATETYDPATGKMVDQSPGLVGSLLSNLVPQTQIAGALAGGGGSPKTLAAALGLPTSLTRVDVPATYAKAELAREQDQTAVFKQALSSGDWSTALTYPALVPLLTAIAQARSRGQLTAYNPTSTGTPSVLESIGQGVSGG